MPLIFIQCCAACKYMKGACGAYFCLNTDSEHYADWVKPDYCCEDYEDAEESRA